MSRNKDFIMNTIIIFIGKFATQFMSLLLLPLFTRYLLSEDYGLVDLFQTYISLFTPILTFRIDSALFRFLVDKRNNYKEISKTISNSILILSISLIITTSIGLVLFKFINIKYFGYVILNLIVLMISSSLLHVLRGLGKTKDYSIASIITGIITLITNIILIIVVHMDAKSILISSSIANSFCIIYIIIRSNLFKYIKLNLINLSTLKEILKYTLPMIPNSLSWWIVNVSDRTIISLFIGIAYNGIYTVSCKFSNILNSIYSIFHLSWQETVILHIDDEDSDKYLSTMINKLLNLFSSMSILIVVVLPFLYDILVGKEYLTSYNYIPILLYSNSWNVLISLIGAIYVARKETKKVANTTIISAIINLIIHFCLIKFIGLYAACISTLISYMVMAIYRYIDSKKYANYKLDIKNIIIFTIIFILSYIMYLINNIFINTINLIIALVYIFIVNKYIFKYKDIFINKNKY